MRAAVGVPGQLVLFVRFARIVPRGTNDRAFWSLLVRRTRGGDKRTCRIYQRQLPEAITPGGPAREIRYVLATQSTTTQAAAQGGTKLLVVPPASTALP